MVESNVLPRSRSSTNGSSNLPLRVKIVPAWREARDTVVHSVHDYDRLKAIQFHLYESFLESSLGIDLLKSSGRNPDRIDVVESRKRVAV